MGAALLEGTRAVVLPRQNECRKTQVAVLGAGVSGMTAAQALANASVTDFLIVERNNHIGGRLAATQDRKKRAQLNDVDFMEKELADGM